jgi:ABC-type protease/lipase transport system fused ATPase/permease subunit
VIASPAKRQAVYRHCDLSISRAGVLPNCLCDGWYFSALVNILMLIEHPDADRGNLHAQGLRPYIPSRSVPTLASLSLIVIAVFAIQGMFDELRQVDLYPDRCGFGSR